MEQTPTSGASPQDSPEADGNRTSWLSIAVVVIILIGFGLTAFYGVRVLRSYRQLHRMPLQPGVTDVNLVRTWMTIPYIARAYRVPEDVLWQGLGIPREGNRYKSLRILDRVYANGQPSVILNRVKDLIHQYQIQHPAPATPSPHTFVARPPGQQLSVP